MRAATQSAIFDEPAARLLVFGGILLIVFGLVLGELFAIFISHGASEHILRYWTEIIAAATRHDSTAIAAGFAHIENLLELRGRIIDTHSHVIAYGFIALTLALLQPILGMGEGWKRWLAACLVIGGFTQALAIFASYYTPRWSFFMADVGGWLIVAAIAGNLVGLYRSRHAMDFNAQLICLLRSSSSRILLRTGAVLILAGMLFGFYYAWLFVSKHEPQQKVLLEQTLAEATNGRATDAIHVVTAYRRLQSRIAIITAAHSHAIEMGSMAILLAFVQDFVLLSSLWKRRWAVVFASGAASTPICIYCASLFGLVAAGFADFSGTLSLTALLVMLYGITRYMGAHDPFVHPA